MPAVSKAQQRFFGMVHAYQTGKLSGEKVSNAIKRVANTISPEEAKKYATTSHKNLDEILRSIVMSPAYTEQLIREAAKNNTVTKINGQYIDTFTSRLLVTALDNLTKENKTVLLQKPIHEMVLLSYKIITH
jgi:hypothetical protein